MAGDFTQYSSAQWLSTAMAAPIWIPEDQKDRINSYSKYEELYWNDERSLILMRRGTEMQPILVPNPKLICDTTSHFLLKGLDVNFPSGKARDALKAFLKREKFYSKFMVAKHSGVVRGDFILHITADGDKPEGKRLCINSVDPGSYFPVYDPDDLDSVIAVHLVEAFMEGKLSLLRRKTYREIPQQDGSNRITVAEVVVRQDPKWWTGGLPIERVVIAEQLLPEEITAIPVYHFKNIDWQGQPFGSSELRGLERIIAGIDQTISDEELALALEGLGVYATDAGRPKDDNGVEVPWMIGPGMVEEVPSGAFFKRVEGIKSVTPMLDHVNYLDDKLLTAAGVFDAANLDVQIAQSGIALAIHFLPQMAKMEERELEGQDTLAQMFFDWCSWSDAYEGTSFAGTEPTITLGDKLPIDRAERMGELNNMFDRKIISSSYYRDEMEKLGYVFPDDMEQQVMDEQMKKFELAQQMAPVGVGPDGKPLSGGDPANPNKPTLPQPGSTSNNKSKVNESDGTESKQGLGRQTKANR